MVGNDKKAKFTHSASIHFSSFQRNMIIDFKIIFLYIQCNLK